MTTKEIIRNELKEAQQTLEAFINDKNIGDIAAASKIMAAALKKGNKIISCGNGGSMCDAMHFAEELSGRFRNNRKALAAVAISDASHITCVGNDYGFDQVFSRYVQALGKKGDVLLGISTSGNSANVIAAAKAARSMGMKIVTLTGKDGGKLAGLSDVEIRSPKSEYADRAQEIHIKIIHSLILTIEKSI